MADVRLLGGGIYVFAGGFTIGSSRYFKPLFHMEGNNYGVSTFKENFPDVPVYIPQSSWPLDQYAGKVSYVWANPPCAPWSVAGRSLTHGKDSWKTDPRVECWAQTYGAFEALQPSVLAIESVTQVFTRGREMLDAFAERAHKLGYAVTYLLVDAKYLGLQQTRKRFFFIAHKVKIPWQAPKFDTPVLTVGDMLERFDGMLSPDDYYTPVRDSHKKLLAELKQGERFRDVWERHNPPESWEYNATGVKGRPRMMIFRLRADKVMPTITGDFFIHPTEDRPLTNKEMTLLMGYPVEYTFPVKEYHVPSLLARGVSPTVAAWLAKYVHMGIRAGLPEQLVTNIVDFRTPDAQGVQGVINAV